MVSAPSFGFVSLFDGAVRWLRDQLGEVIESPTHLSRTFETLGQDFVVKETPFPTGNRSLSNHETIDADARYRESPEALASAHDKLQREIIKPKV